MDTNDLIEPILRSNELPQIIQKLQVQWEKEQEKRHIFWDKITDDIKAEFILGEEITYHSPVKRSHTKAGRNILFALMNYNESTQ